MLSRLFYLWRRGPESNRAIRICNRARHTAQGARTYDGWRALAARFARIALCWAISSPFVATCGALLLASAAYADTVTESTTTWTLRKNSATGSVVTTGTGLEAACHAAADAIAPVGSTNYWCIGAFTTTRVASLPICPTSPQPDTTHQQACESPLYGTYPQTQGWTLHASPACWVNDGAVAPTAGPIPPCSTTPPSGTYSTNFSTPQTPLSEGGNWARASNQWTNVTTVDGFARGTNGITDNYDDSYAILQGPQYGNDYTITVTAARTAAVPSAAVNEAEILVRCSDTTNSASCVELSFLADGQFGAAVWSGPFQQFTNLSNETWQADQGKVTEGTTFKVIVAGSVVKAYRGSLLIFQNSHVPYATGNPGIGFFIRPGYVQGYGWRTFSVTAP